MFDIGIDVKSNCVVATVMHLPTNILKKNSSKTAEQSIAICVSDIHKELRDLDWLCCEVVNGQVASIDFSGCFKAKSTGISYVVLESIVDRTLSKINSLHQFSDGDSGFVSMTFKKHENIRLFFENLFLIEGAELESY